MDEKIFESPDGGKTVYVRPFGSSDRILYSESDEVRTMREQLQERELWNCILQESRTNESLKTALDRAIMIYHLSKKDNG
jgi:hypothetical protein